MLKITDAKYVISSASYTQCPEPTLKEYAFIGRSNVGKSSLINMLCEKQHLAKTSGTPGKTQLINHFIIDSKTTHPTLPTEFVKWYLVDLPGYGYAKVSASSRRRWQQMIEEYIRKRPNLVSLFVLIDSRHTPQAIDLEFIADLGNWDIPFAIIFTKEDKNKPAVTVRNVELFKQALSEQWDEMPSLFISSATTKKGREEILQYIDFCNGE